MQATCGEAAQAPFQVVQATSQAVQATFQAVQAPFQAVQATFQAVQAPSFRIDITVYSLPPIRGDYIVFGLHRLWVRPKLGPLSAWKPFSSDINIINGLTVVFQTPASCLRAYGYNWPARPVPGGVLSDHRTVTHQTINLSF